MPEPRPSGHADPGTTARTGSSGTPRSVPGAVLGAAALVAAEAVALVGFVAFFCYELVTATATDTGTAVAETVFTAAGAMLLLALARSLSRVRRWARSPTVVLQIVFLPVGYSLAFQAERPYAGLPVLVAALVILYLLMTPTARLAFDRE